MTWGRFRPELATEAARDQLTADEFCLHVEVSLWIYATEDASLKVPAHMLRRISIVDSPEGAAAGLAARGWWRQAGEAWEIRKDANVIRASFIATEAKRERDRKDQAAKRERDRKKTSGTDSAAESETTSYLANYLPTDAETTAKEQRAREAGSNGHAWTPRVVVTGAP